MLAFELFDFSFFGHHILVDDRFIGMIIRERRMDLGKREVFVFAGDFLRA